LAIRLERGGRTISGSLGRRAAGASGVVVAAGASGSVEEAGEKAAKGTAGVGVAGAIGKRSVSVGSSCCSTNEATRRTSGAAGVRGCEPYGGVGSCLGMAISGLEESEAGSGRRNPAGEGGAVGAGGGNTGTTEGASAMKVASKSSGGWVSSKSERSVDSMSLPGASKWGEKFGVASGRGLGAAAKGTGAALAPKLGAAPKGTGAAS
jgi:hypothetical protein